MLYGTASGENTPIFFGFDGKETKHFICMLWSSQSSNDQCKREPVVPWQQFKVSSAFPSLTFLLISFPVCVGGACFLWGQGGEGKGQGMGEELAILNNHMIDLPNLVCS